MYPLLLLILFFLLHSLIIAQPPGGLTFESCLSDLGCTKPRRCVDTSTFRVCKTPKSAACICVPPSFTPCTKSVQCIEGEVCARELETPFVCTSALVAVPPNGPVTAEEAAEKAFIPNCPRPKRSDPQSRQFIPPPPPDSIPPPPPPPPPGVPAPPGAPPDAPPPPSDFSPVPGPPGGLPPTITDPKRNGLNFEICKSGTCAKGLSCVTMSNQTINGPPTEGGRSGGQSFRCCIDTDPICFCHPKDGRPVCLSTADCSRGEVCAKTPITPPTCTSTRALDERFTPGQKRKTVIFEGEQPGKPGKPVPLVETPKPSSEEIEETPGGSPEEADTPKVSEEPKASPSATVTPTPRAVATSVSPTAEESSDASPEVDAQGVEGVCVDAEALRHLDRSALVFEHDRHARVLCNVDGSCATAGHMVSFEGKAMMMTSYCRIVGCEEKVIKVNSPRYRRGMIVDSRTEGLAYTSLAARYGTRVEEGVLAGVIRLGL